MVFTDCLTQKTKITKETASVNLILIQAEISNVILTDATDHSIDVMDRERRGSGQTSQILGKIMTKRQFY